MATKRPSKPAAKPTPKTSPKKLQNLAAKHSSLRARKTAFDDAQADDEQLVDNSGVFRVTSAIVRDQIGHEDDNNPRFANDSLVMAAQRGGFREEPGEDPIDEALVDDETTAATKRQRLATLATLAAQRKPRR
jgi:hypothetical protein